MPAILTFLAPLMTPIINVFTKLFSFIAAYRSGRNRQKAVDVTAQEKAQALATATAQKETQSFTDNMTAAGDAAPSSRAEIIELAREGKL